MQQSNKMLLGKILTTIGAISEEDLHRMLRLKAEEGIYDVFAWPEGEFRFLDEKLPPPDTMVPIALDVTAIVLEGMQRLDEWRRMREVIPHAHCVPVVVGALDESVMIDGAPQILALVDDDRTVDEICRTIHSTEFHVGHILMRQVLAGAVKIVKPRTGAPVAEPEKAAAAGTTPAISGEALTEAARQLLEKKELDAALRHARAARALEPDNSRVTAAAQKIEDRLRLELEKSGMKLDSIPALAMPMEELAKQKLSPQEGFALTRIDGSSDLASLLKLGPMPPLDTQLLFWKLLQAGFVKLNPKRQ